MKRLLVAIAALAFSVGATAQLYKWRDKNGHMQYGDTPPPGVQATPMRAPATPPSAPATADAKKAEGKSEKALSPEEAFRKRQEERKAAEEKSAQEQAQAQQKRANCDQAQTQLRMLNSGIRMSTINAAGERVYLDDNQRAAETARAQKAVADWCS